MRNRADARVRHEAHHAGRAGVNVDAVRLSENGIGCGNVERSGDGTAAQDEKPGLSFRLQAPSGVWRQIDPLEHEVGAGDEKRPFVGEPVRSHPKMGRSGVCHRDCAFDVKLTLAAVIEQAERCVAALLDLCDDEPGADRVNRSGGHENDVVRQHGLPHDKIRDRAVVHGLAQLLLESAAASGRERPWLQEPH